MAFEDIFAQVESEVEQAEGSSRLMLEKPFAGDFSAAPPDELASFYRDFADGLDFIWEVEGSCGGISLMGYADALQVKEQLAEEIAEVAQDPQDTPENQAAFDDLQQEFAHWWPLFEEENGDLVCMDARNGSVVWYDHEWFDDEVLIREPLVLAASLNELLEKWAPLWFVDNKEGWWGMFREIGGMSWHPSCFVSIEESE